MDPEADDRKTKMAQRAGWLKPQPEIVRLVRSLAIDDARRDHEAAIEALRRQRKIDDGGSS
ncbi:hypothetical protein ABS772_13815 [Methylorubrum podarium]|uniref:Uncharacterized protein n=1 Tax=Methylorubrum podarium TaxID=200476 RepID=A0ABV1QNK5_9HYPH